MGRSPISILASWLVLFPPFPLCFPSEKVQTPLPPPLGNDWWSSHLTRYSSHTRHSDYFFSLTVMKQPQEKKCASAYSRQEILIAYSRPIINILSAHAHGKGLGATQKVRYQCMSPGNPKHHAPRLLCRFLHDLLALKRPSRKWGPGGNWVGCKMACFGWNTHPSTQGSSTLTPLSPQDSPLDPFRGVSSCEGPGGQTWKNTCKARVRLCVSPRLLARTTP